MAPKPPPSLVRHLREGRCVLFVGSGLSVGGGLPTWRGLLQHILDELRAEEPDRPDLGELSELLAAAKYLEVADYCKEWLGPKRYADILTEQLRGAEGDIPEPHQIIVNLPFAAVVTTNYDKLLEHAYARLADRLPKTPTHLDLDALGPLLFDGSFFILKAHGDIDRPESMVLTTRDYQEIIHSNPAFNEIFSALLLTNAILFVGYSLSDPDFRLLLDRQLTIFKGYVPERYALMSGVNRVERDVLWRAARIRVLPYPKDAHHEVLAFLRNLQHDLERPRLERPQPWVDLVRRHAGLQQDLEQPHLERWMVEEPALERTAPISKAVRPVAAEVRQPEPTPSSVLSIRLQGREVEATLATSDQAVIAQGVGQLPDWSDLIKLLRATVSPARANAEQFRQVGLALAESLPERVLGGLEELEEGDVITLRLTADTGTLPWEWTYVGGQWLFVRNPTVRAPIGVSDQARGHPLIHEPVRALLIGDTLKDDPQLQLPQARLEVQQIAELYHNRPNVSCTTLIGPQADFDAIVRHFLTADYDIVHFAGHAWMDTQEAYLMLHGRQILRASELGSLLSRHPPAILVLNSHFTAFVPPGIRPSDFGEMRMPQLDAEDLESGPTMGGRVGFVKVASATGVGAFIGCLGEPSDPVAREIGVNLHRELLAGRPVAAALHKVRAESCLAETKRPDSNLTAFTYVISGYPELTLA
jgi:CHAT domain-containing protein